MTDLAAWLLDRIAEDEEWARDPASPDYADGKPRTPGFLGRVLAECDARRQIVYFALECRADEARWPRSGIMAARHGAALVCLCLLALPYADQPGYREEWHP
jgi:hypothetical protein